MKIQIFGTGCPNCKRLAETAEEAARVLGLEYELEKITEINEIVAAGVMIPPALAVNDEIKLEGKVPSLNEIKNMIS